MSQGQPPILFSTEREADLSLAFIGMSLGAHFERSVRGVFGFLVREHSFAEPQVSRRGYQFTVLEYVKGSVAIQDRVVYAYGLALRTYGSDVLAGDTSGLRDFLALHPNTRGHRTGMFVGEWQRHQPRGRAAIARFFREWHARKDE